MNTDGWDILTELECGFCGTTPIKGIVDGNGDPHYACPVCGDITDEYLKRRFCDCQVCPCNVPLPHDHEGDVCPACADGHHRDWVTGELQ